MGQEERSGLSRELLKFGVGAEPSLWRVDTWLSQMHSGLLGVEVDASGQGG